MKIKSGLVFNRSTGRLVGFTDLGDVNNELDVLIDSSNRVAKNQT